MVVQTQMRADGALPRFPLDEDADKARLKRVGVIDAGSNSVRLVVFDGIARSPAYFYNEKVLCGLGAGLSETGRLNPEGWARAMASLHRFRAITSEMELNGMIAVATAAVREAEDGPAFCQQVERETGLHLHVATGSEEARLAAMGVLLGWPEADGLVCDMGGASMELARVRGGEIEECGTSPLGPLKLAGVAGAGGRDALVNKGVSKLLAKAAGPAGRLFLVGGSWRAIARLDMERTGYPLIVLHGYEPPVRQLVKTLEWVREQDLSELSTVTGTSMARLSLVPLAGLVLEELLRQVDPERVTISAYGLREGLLYRQMPRKMRASDPLIVACRHMEQASARNPGFGDALYDWLAPLYAGRPERELRLIRAACLLHDINWREHPDYRAELSFESVTHSSVAGIDHAERAFLGMALLSRYKSVALWEGTRQYTSLIGRDRMAEAVVLGKAMRLGAMLSGSSPGLLEIAQLGLSEKKVTLTLSGIARDLAGETVDRRLQSLASRLGREAELVLA